MLSCVVNTLVSVFLHGWCKPHQQETCEMLIKTLCPVPSMFAVVTACCQKTANFKECWNSKQWKYETLKTARTSDISMTSGRTWAKPKTVSIRQIKLSQKWLLLPSLEFILVMLTSVQVSADESSDQIVFSYLVLQIWGETSWRTAEPLSWLGRLLMLGPVIWRQDGSAYIQGIFGQCHMS